MNHNDSNKSVYQPPSFWNKITNLYNKTDYVRPMLLLLFFVFSAIFMYNYIQEPSKLAKSSYTYYFLLLLVLLGIGYYLYKNPSKITSLGSLVFEHPFLTTILTCTFIVISVITYTFLSTRNSNTYYWTGRMVNIFTVILIVIVTFLLFYHFISNVNLSQRGWSGLILEIITYLPCKIQEFLVWFLGEIKNTPRKVFFLLLIEFALIVWIFYYQNTLKWFSIGQQVFPIYNGSLYLTKPTPITSYSNISSQTGISNQTVPMNFGIAFWFHVNDNNQSLETELPLFCYGGGKKEVSKDCSSSNPYGNQNIHPAITFIPTHLQMPNQKSENLWQGAGLTWNKGHIKVYFSHCSPENENAMIIDVPLQRWNLLALNYTSQKADVFLNGEIVASHTFKEPPIYSSRDSITVGGNDLQGAIQDIQYSVLPFSKTNVNAMYNNNIFINKVLPTFITR